MSATVEEKAIEVVMMNIPSPLFSATSSSTTSESDAIYDEPEGAADFQQEDNESSIQEEEEEEEEEEGAENGNSLVIFGRDSPRSITPPDYEEERGSCEEYPPSERVYSSSSCSISAVLQRQCCDLWRRFDSIGTEMIVTRRGR